MPNTNRLAHSSSPYLKQHAHNPVDWYPWGEEALEKARLENKPILLSIGYASCHWCHVMAHESFENAETANLMNQLYVNIKVDREERPDLDKIYQTAHYILTRQNGGWPLTIFLTPDLIPFFSGTYFPDQARYQLPAFKDVLRGIANFYQQKPADIQQQNAELIKILHAKHRAADHIQLSLAPIQAALQILQGRFDSIHGGFGGAPKFPQPPRLEFLLMHDSSIVTETLHRMANGGIYDHLGGGFFRYSVDAAWHIPHFEKMLCDNAQLLFLYASISQHAHSSFAETARETAEWAMQTMQSPEGGYYSSIDADSEGEEGKFYVWEREAIQALLSGDEYEAVSKHYNLLHEANFEKRWHLHVTQLMERPETAILLQSAKAKLLAARSKRIAPAIDKKILTSWNSLMIKGMLVAGDILNEPRFTHSAEQALAFIKEKLWVNQRLLVTYNDGKASLSGYLDDYVFLIDALLTAVQIHWDAAYLQFAIELAEIVLDHFQDPEGGFFFTANDHEKLLYRPKTMMDEAIPAGNGTAARVFLLLGYLLGNSRYIDAAQKTLEAAWPALIQFPAEHCGLLIALQEFLQPSKIIIIRGEEEIARQWKAIAQQNHNVVFVIPPEAENLPEALASKILKGQVCAYICQGLQCLEVVTDAINLQKGEPRDV